MLLSTLTLLMLSSTILAQDLSVPTAWRKPTTSLSQSTRIARAQRGIDTMLTQLDASTGQFTGIGFWQAGNAWSAIANEDYFTTGTRYKSQVTNALNTAFGMWVDYDQFGCYNDDAMWWAQAAVYAYRAYGDTNLLSHAVATWNHVSNFVVTPQAASSGSLPGKSFKITGTCEGLDNNHNINSNGIVLDTVPATWLFTYNSGKYIEGLSWRNSMINVVAAAVNDGIITEGASPTQNGDGVGFKAVFIRGLLEAFSRNKSNTALQTLIRSYIDVQYNALIDLASSGDAYSSAWHGPAQNFTTWGQLAALDVLGSAIAAN
ncbi:hypothetical protein BDQ17DRAFT_1368327 [Cyathus striatus]|nr:hypothetical protein BDQ17DRAFT_1368327 [Cyathus striatus]